MEQKKDKRPIDKVTTKNLDIALRMTGIEVNKRILDKIIDIVELIEEKGDNTSIEDICKLEVEWSNLAKLSDDLDKMNNKRKNYV